jgi:hypothetical protein
MRGIRIGVTVVVSAGLALVASTSQAQVLGGQIVEIAAPASATHAGGPLSASEMFLFPEREEVMLAAPLKADLTSTSRGAGTIPAGSVVDSYYVMCNKNTQPRVALDATVSFDENILGVIWTTTKLTASDAAFGAPGTNYGGSYANRGFESSEDSVKAADPTKAVEKALAIHCEIGNVTDQVRILVGVTPDCNDGDGDLNPDNDGDGLCDNWEIDGIDANRDGTIDLQLYDVNKNGAIEASEDADPDHKDIYIELDYMAKHSPNSGAIADVITAFANSPVNNPDGATGIRLHIQTGESFAHNNNLSFAPCTGAAAVGSANSIAIKAKHFGTPAERAAGTAKITAKRFMSHYLLYAHNLAGLGGTSGCGELPGNDFVVSLGSWTVVGGHGVGTRDEQAGTLMHELGHNLNLRHGGANDDNCKPNYLSVMTYTRQINNAPIPGRQLDFSRQSLANLNEAALGEPAGVGGPAGFQTAYGPGAVLVVAANAAIDWNRDGDATDVGVARDINNIATSGCDGSGTVLTGHDDWSNLVYDFQNAGGGVYGAPTAPAEPLVELTYEQAATMSGDADGDRVLDLDDNCPKTANSAQADANVDGIGNACGP